MTALPLRPPGAPVHRRPPPLPALAPPGLLRVAPPRRGAVPVRARNDGSGHARGRRHTVRRVRLAAVARAGRGAERRPRPGRSGMTDIAERFDARLARGTSGLLREFNDAGVIAAADVHVAHRLTALLGGTTDSVLLAAALAVRAPRIGHVFVDLERIHETATVDVDEPIDLDNPALARAIHVDLVRRSQRPGRPRPASRPRGQRALPRPLLARGAAGRRRPEGTRRPSRRRRRGPPRRRHRPPLHGRDPRRAAEAGRRRRGPPPARSRRRRPGHR